MAKPKKRSASKKPKGGKSAKPFLGAFAATVLVLGLGWWLFDVYAWGATTPSLTLRGWPVILALGLAAALGLAYWRGGKAVFWGVLVAVGAGAAVATFMPGYLP